MIEWLEDFTAEIIIIGVGLIITTIIAQIKKAGKAHIELKKCVDKQGQRGIRHGKAFVELGEHLDQESERLHPDNSPRPIKSRLERLVKDEKGNF